MTDSQEQTPAVQRLQTEAQMMNLEDLYRAREIVEIVDIGIDGKELLTRYEALYSAAVSDVLRELCMMDQALPSHIQPLHTTGVVAGFAFTVKSAPNTKVAGEMALRTKMLTEITQDAIIIWDTSGEEDATAWGGVMTSTALSLGVRAAIIDGGVRDVTQIMQTEFPVYHKYRSPNGSLGRQLISHYQTMIKIGNVTIMPGDVVVADPDGVVIVPRRLAVQVLERAEQIVSNEHKIFSWIDDGDSIEEVTKKGGYF